jgi:hypothetical protein
LLVRLQFIEKGKKLKFLSLICFLTLLGRPIFSESTEFQKASDPVFSSDKSKRNPQSPTYKPMFKIPIFGDSYWNSLNGQQDKYRKAWEESIENDPPKLAQAQLKEGIKDDPKDGKTASKSANQDEEDWESALLKEVDSQQKQQKKFENSRNTTSPTQINPLTADRSVQNLMMDVMAAVDMVGQWDKNKPQTTSNSFDVREAEFGMFGAIDQFGRGTLLVAAHNEGGRYYFEIHEANILFPFLSKYVNVKLGRFFLDVGRLNRIHRHDWNFTFAPIVHQRLLDTEAVEDTGAEVSILLPFWKKMTTELVLGATNGRYWGHTHTAGVNKNNPMMYAHLKNFIYLGNNWGLQFGGTGMRYEIDPVTKAVRYQYGLDSVVRWNQSMLKSFILMSELWYRENRYPDKLDPISFVKSPIPMETFWGYYVFLDYQFHQQWSIGYRYDFFNVPNLRDKNGSIARNAVEGNTVQLTYKPSEFSYIRASTERRYTADFSSETGNPEFVDWRYYIQATFILGSHPAHKY